MKPPIDENEQAEHVLETLRETGFDSIYSLITTLFKFNSLCSKKSYQIAFALLINEENRSHFLKDNCFCQVICKYTSAIDCQEIKALVAHKTLQFSISKVNIKTLKKFNVFAIVQC